MLAELAAANAAFAIIKTAVQNTGDLTRVAHKISEYSIAKSKLEKHSRADKAVGKKDSNLEFFMAVEQIRKNEQELKELMIWSGRAGLWDDWVKFQAQARVQRKREEAEAEAFRIEFHNNIGKAAIAIAIILGISGLIYFAIYLKTL